jgi:hypothetical protein
LLAKSDRSGASRSQVPNVNAIELVSERRLVAADAQLEARVVVEIDVRVEQRDSVVEVLQRELILDGLGEVAFEVDAGPGVVEAAAGKPRSRMLIDHPVELGHPADAEGVLVVIGRPNEAAVIEVVAGLERHLAEMGIADLLGRPSGGRVAAGGFGPAACCGG